MKALVYVKEHEGRQPGHILRYGPDSEIAGWTNFLLSSGVVKAVSAPDGADERFLKADLVDGEYVLSVDETMRLEKKKEEKIAEVEGKAKKEVGEAPGVFDGKEFHISIEERVNCLGMLALAKDLVWPQTIWTKGGEEYQLAKADLEGYALAVFGAAKDVMDQAKTKKELIKNAKSVEDVEGM